MTGPGGVTSAAGFRAAGVAAGLKSSGGRDVAVVVNDGPEFSAAVVTTANRVKAAPVLWTQRALQDGSCRVVVLNSGGANACTGALGMRDTELTAAAAAQLLGGSIDEIAVCSTGLIGVRLPMDRLLHGVRSAFTDVRADGGDDAAWAILTTDTRPKTASARCTSTGGAGVTVGGMAKGAGMLAPSLATMLVVITTDAQVAPVTLDSALRSAVATTFERLDSDGCMSTNDTVVAMASGASQVMVGRDLPESQFVELLTDVCHGLAQQMLDDAEGASKQIEIVVSAASSEADAVEVGRAVARSNLFKCAVHGGDPNWGRVLAAVGTTTAAFDPTDISVAMNGSLVCVDGAALAKPPEVDLSGPRVEVEITLGAGSSTATIWTNDLTAAYVHENSAYST